MKFLLVLATARKGRRSEKVADLLRKEIVQQGHEVMFVDVRDYPITATDNTEESDLAKRYIALLEEADGFVWVSPEYNHGYPGEFKQLVDLAYSQYAKKPVMICSVSKGQWGGTRAVELLRLLAVNFHMVPTGQPMMFKDVRSYFDDDGKPVDQEAFRKQFERSFADLLWYAKALKEARDN